MQERNRKINTLAPGAYGLRSCTLNSTAAVPHGCNCTRNANHTQATMCSQNRTTNHANSSRSQAGGSSGARVLLDEEGTRHTSTRVSSTADLNQTPD